MEHEHRVVVKGTASRKVAPDRVVWGVRVVEVEPDEQMAFDRCAARLNVVTESLEQALGDDAELMTQGVRVVPHWEGARPRGVEAVAELWVSAPTGRAGEAARVAMSDGGGRVEGPHFAVSDADARREELLADAVEAARRKAEHAATAAGRRLGRAVRIVERDDVQDHAASGMSMRSAAGAEVAEPRIEPVDQTLSATATVTFELDG